MKPCRATFLIGTASLAILVSSPARSQDMIDLQQADIQDEFDEELVGDDSEILVLAERLRGQVDAPQPPVLVLEEADIAAYGAGSIADLIQQLSPQTSSSRGRGGGFPVILVNGMRISSFRELRSYPPEAIRRLEVLPEEVALRYGYSADQRVINFILKDNYMSTEIELEYGQPFRGGNWTGEVEATLLRIQGSDRLNINLGYDHTSALTDFERGIIEPASLIPTVAGDPDPARQRTLIDPGNSYSIDGTYTMGVGNSGGSLAINASYEKTDQRDRDGYNIVLLTDPADNTELRIVNPDDVIVQMNEVDSYSIGATLNHPLGDWDFSGTIDGSISDTRTYSDQLLDTSGLVAGALAGDFAIDGILPVLPSADSDLAQSTSRNFDSLATVNGILFYMPAGDVTATVRAGYGITEFESSDTFSLAGDVALRRNSLQAGFNLGVPLTSRRDDVLAAIGDLSLNFSGGLTDLSDFGTLYDWTAGLSWSPTDALNLQATYFYDEAAPGLTQLGSPVIQRQNVAVYDFANNETVLIETTSGGNPFLSRETRKDIRLSAQWQFPFYEDASLQVEFNKNSSQDIASGFPGLLTPDIEGAFPGRVTRAMDGTLLALDLRPVTYARQDSKRIRWGISFGGQIGGSSREEDQQEPAQQQAGPPEGGQRQQVEVGPNGPAFAGGPGGGGPGGNFDPERFQQMRAQMCDSDADLTQEQIAGLPPMMLERVRDENGEIDQQRLGAMRERFCSSETQIIGGPGGPGGFDSSRFDAIRESICSAPEGEIPDLSELPEQMLQRLRGEDGEIDPERFAALRSQICASGQAQGEGQQQAQGGGGGAVRFGGPGGGPRGPGGGGGPRGGRGGGGGPPMGAILGRMTGGGGGPPGGRFFFNLYHTIELQNELLIAEGLPVLDLLDGDALSGGGTVRHSAQLEGGMFFQGKGLRLSARYSGPSRIDGSGLPGSSDLEFGSQFTLDLRTFIDLGQHESIVEAVPFLSGSRFSISVDNVFDSYRRVTDQFGDVPLAYQPGLLNPSGRTFEIEFRKLF